MRLVGVESEIGTWEKGTCEDPDAVVFPLGAFSDALRQTTVRLALMPLQPGAHVLTAHVRGFPADPNTENNWATNKTEVEGDCRRDSEPGLGIRLLTSGLVGIELVGTPGLSYGIQRSSSVVQWPDLKSVWTNVVLTSPTNRLQDSEPAESPSRRLWPR